MEPRECFDDLLFRKLLLVTTLDKQSKTFQYNFDMMPDVYARYHCMVCGSRP